MDFVTLSSETKMIVELAADFTKKEILPVAAQSDRDAVFPEKIYKKGLDAGLVNLNVPEAFGGPGLGHLDFILVTEQLAWACVGIAGALSLNHMIADVILIGGSDSQKNNYLRRMAQGEIGSYALTEPGAGSNAVGIQTSAVKKGDKYILNGSKTWISNASVANFFIVFAKTDPTAAHKGISAFFVERNTPGLKVGKDLPKLGQKSFPAAEVFFENVEISKDQLVGGVEGQGFTLAMKVFDHSRPMVGAFGMGLTKRCLDESVNYGKTRKTVDKPIVAHQMVAQKIAEMGMRLEASRLLTYKAADCLDKKIPNTLLASYSKTFASDTAVWASNEAVQIFGGMGYSTEYPVEKLYRDSKVLQIYEGTNEIQRIIMARELSK
jgi:acyl-CoA dehydrogenase